VACKQWNDLPAIVTDFFGGPGYQNPADLSGWCWTLVKFLTEGGKKNDLDVDDNWNFLKYQCMHCRDAACINVCEYRWGVGTAAMKRDASTGFVYINEPDCRNPGGCIICKTGYESMPGCPFDVPRRRPGNPPFGAKCTGCVDRVAGVDYRGLGGSWTTQYPPGIKDGSSDWLHIPGQPANDDLLPACVTSCPTGSLQYDTRVNIVAAATARVADADVVAKYPGVNLYGDGPGPYGGLNVITVLTRDPGWYGLPPNDATL